MASRIEVAAIAFLFFLFSAKACDVDDVALYRVSIQFMWSEDVFPKDYPVKAQWSKVFGQSHNKSYTLFHIGETTNALVHDFAQFGNVDELIENGEEDSRVHDQFTAPAVKDGVGETENVVFVDGEHSLISFICRMMPSPDWFVGVDSLDLCVDSSWIDQVTLDLDPLDAGVTEISGSQAVPISSESQHTIHKIGIQDPKHPSSSFYYRKLRHLPAIAKVEFNKIKEYSTKDLNDIVRKELISKIAMKDQRKELYTESKIQNSDYNIKNEYFTTKNPYEELKDLEEEPVGTPRPNNPENNVVVVTHLPMNLDSKEDYDSDLNNMDDVVLAVATGHKLGLGKHLPRHFKSRLHHAVNKHRRLTEKDCQVTEWSDWSKCSDPCSPSGFMTRKRTVIFKKKSRPCPELIEKKPCGHRCRGDDYGW